MDYNINVWRGWAPEDNEKMLNESYLNQLRQEKEALLEDVKNAYEARAKIFRKGEWTRQEMLDANHSIQRASWAYQNCTDPRV